MNGRLYANSGKFILFQRSKNFMSRRETGWRSSGATGMANGAYESMNNTESVSDGAMAMPLRSKLLITTKSELEEGVLMPALHPGEMLREEFMKPLGLSANALAIALRVPVTRISEIVRERRGITADTALRLARYFNMTPEFWMRLQMDYDLESAADTEQSMILEEIRPRPGYQRQAGNRKHAIA